MTDNVAGSLINDSSATAAFPRAARLRKPQQFQQTFAQGRRISAALFRLHLRLAPSAVDAAAPLGNPGHAVVAQVRLGIAVSKRIDARAVGRNRIKRIARESFRAMRARLPAGDYVLLAQREAAQADNTRLAQALHALWVRAIAAGAAGTAAPQCGSINTGPAQAIACQSEPAESVAALKRGPAAITMPPRDMFAATPGRLPESH